MGGEVWKPIPGYSFYEASSFGRVRRLSRYQSGKFILLKRPVIVPGWSKIGYLYARLRSDEGILHTSGIHRWVAIAFHGLPGPKMHAAHANGRPGDNRPENIAWLTASENALQKEDHGTVPRGERHVMSKLSESEVRRVLSDARSNRAMAQELNISEANISMIRRRKTWTHLTEC